MSDTVIKVQNLSKRYRIGKGAGYRTFRETLNDAVAAPFRHVNKLLNSKHNFSDSMQSSKRDDFIWALKDIFFEVNQGEAVGIIGKNGAGKSTLLKILSRITQPSAGRVVMRGRVGSLLEVGTGFHPELTGHENVYMYGAILGMDRWEVTRKYDEIITFAGIEKYIETPVKRYSSGMYMRLAFAVAAHLEPEILIVDEVLAVGDVHFQKKCLGKMDGVARQGRTVLFVSHNMQAIKQLCQKGILLKSGMISEYGSANSVVNSYLAGFNRSDFNQDIVPEMHQVYPPGLEIYRVELLNRNEELTQDLHVNEAFTIRMLYKINQPDKQYFIGVSIRSAEGILIATASSLDGLESLYSSPNESYRLESKMENILTPGEYTIEIKVKSMQYLMDLIEGIPLTILPVSVSGSTSSRPGLVQWRAEWNLEKA